MSDGAILLIINSVIIPIVLLILKINRDQSVRIASLETKLDICLERKSQGETWQQGQKRQRDMMDTTALRTGDTKPLV